MNIVEKQTIRKFILVVEKKLKSGIHPYQTFYEPPYHGGDSSRKSSLYYDTDLNEFFEASIRWKPAYALLNKKKPIKINSHITQHHYNEQKTCLYVSSITNLPLKNFYNLFIIDCKTKKKFKIWNLGVAADYFQDRIYFENQIPKKPLTVKCHFDYNDCWSKWEKNYLTLLRPYESKDKPKHELWHDDNPSDYSIKSIVKELESQIQIKF